MQALILILHVLTAIALISLILLQQGKGADVGASFGAGAANTMFGSAGAMSFLMKLTAGLAALFFVTSIILNYVAVQSEAPLLPAAVQQPVSTQVAKPGSSNKVDAETPFVPENAGEHKTQPGSVPVAGTATKSAAGAVISQPKNKTVEPAVGLQQNK